MNNSNFIKNEHDDVSIIDDYIDSEMIDALNESIKISHTDVRPPDETYIEKLIDTSPYPDNYYKKIINNNVSNDLKFSDIEENNEENDLIKAINESVNYNTDLEDIIFERDLKRAFEENERIENERLLRDRNERCSKLNNIMKYIIHADIDKNIITNIKESINDFLEMKTNNIVMDEITYLSFINYLDKKNHRIHLDIVLYIKSKL